MPLLVLSTRGRGEQSRLLHYQPGCSVVVAKRRLGSSINVRGHARRMEQKFLSVWMLRTDRASAARAGGRQPVGNNWANKWARHKRSCSGSVRGHTRCGRLVTGGARRHPRTHQTGKRGHANRDLRRRRRTPLSGVSPSRWRRGRARRMRSDDYILRHLCGGWLKDYICRWAPWYTYSRRVRRIRIIAIPMRTPIRTGCRRRAAPTVTLPHAGGQGGEERLVAPVHPRHCHRGDSPQRTSSVRRVVRLIFARPDDRTLGTSTV